MKPSTYSPLPSPKAKWIWDNSGRFGYHYYLEARRTFSAGRCKAASLLITADAFYQAFLNGRCIGHGPAKSAAGKRSVDCYDLQPFLALGENVLEISVLCVGTGSMTYVPGEAGLLFELRLDSWVIGSDARVEVRRSGARLHPTTRRWVLPCVEDVDAAARPGSWHSAKIVSKTAALYPRRVALPRREPVYPQRAMGVDQVRLPNFSVSFRIKPALVGAGEIGRWNVFSTPASVRIPIISRKAQHLRFTPTLGSMEWSFQGKKLFQGSGWGLHPKDADVSIKLEPGRNELVGRHAQSNHFEHVNLAGFVDDEVEIGPMEIARDDGQRSRINPMLFANPHDLAVGAAVSPDAPVRRTIYDLGCVHNGWISFQARGGATGSALLLAFFEAMDHGAGKRIHWTDGCNNALTYHLREGWQQFESFFAYGVRYIAVHEIGGSVEMRDLHLLKATCTQPPRGHFQTDDPLFNGIYRISAQTLESGIDDTFTDCPTFEQVNWNFDNRVACYADFLTGANYDITRNSMLLFAEDPEHRGLVASQTPTTWSQRIPLWSFNWIFWFWDYYWHTGDLAFVRKVYPRVKAGIHEALGLIGSRGLMEFADVWHFVEWGQGRDDNHAINSIEQAGLAEALEIAEKLARALGQAPEFAPARAKLMRAINRHLWNPAAHCYVDSLHEDGTPPVVSSQVTNAIMGLYGVAREDWSRKLAHDFELERCRLLPPGSPYGLFYILELMDRFGYGDKILSLVGRRWGRMLAEGDGTTWEVFAEFGPTRSRCHPFSAYVIKYLVKYILGVEVLAPGFASVRIRPRAPRHIEAAAGGIPTPCGPLRVSWARRGGKVKVDVDAPKGVRVC